MSFVLAVLLATAIQVRITTIDGTARDASLSNVAQTGLTIDVDGTTQTLALEEVLSVSSLDPAATTTPAMRVELFAGSRIAVTETVTADSRLVLKPRDQPALSLPLTQIRWIRFRPASPAVDPQWLGLIDKVRTADALIVRRAGNALDEVQGIVKSISADAVTVDLEGDDLLAPIDKLEGILFANSAVRPQEGKIIVEDTLGSRWRVVSFKSGSSDAMTLDLGNGITHEIPLRQLRKIETTGSVLFLASETPAQSSYRPVSKLGLNEDVVNRWFAAGPNEGRDLVMHADADAEYRIKDGFSTLMGSVQLDASVVAGGKCSMRIMLDDQVVWDQVFDVDDPAPRGYELPLGKARRVRFEVMNAGDGDIGDTLRLRQPRLVK